MATGGTAPLDAYTRYSRIVLTLGKCCIEVERRVLGAFLFSTGQTLDQFLQQNAPKILKKGRLTKDLYFPPQNQPADLQEWDLGAVCLILTDIATVPPQQQQDLSHLRLIRNKICHCSTPDLGETDYLSYKDDIQNIIDRALTYVNDSGFRQRINKEMKDIEQGAFSAAVHDSLQQLNTWHEVADELNQGNLSTHDKLDELIAKVDLLQVSITPTVINPGPVNVDESIVKSESMDYTEVARGANLMENVMDDDENNSDNDSETNSMASENDGSDIEHDDDIPTYARARHTDSQFDSRLRDYQLELAEDAIQGRNTIVWSETGTGKTWVALYIIKKHMAEACIRPRKVAFMARTGLLINQQANKFMKHLPQYNTKLLTAEDDDSRIMDAFISRYDILCFTPQILVNNLDTGNVKSLSAFSLLVLDECHHTKGHTPYTRLMRRYLIEKDRVKDMPQVVGLTATIGVGNSRTDEEAVNCIMRVCAFLDTRIISTVDRNRTELEKYITVPKEETLKMVIKSPDPCRDTIIEAMENVERTLRASALMQPDLINLMLKRPTDKECQAYNKWTVDMINAAQLDDTDHVTSRKISACAMYLNVYNSALEVNTLLQVQDIMKYLATRHRLESENTAKLTAEERDLSKQLQDVQEDLSQNATGTDNENPNVRMISQKLKQMLQQKKGDDSRAIVFVKARVTCRALAEFLDENLQNCGVRASPLYGKNARAGDEGMAESLQTDILEGFKKGLYKVIVCTSVGTEGIDVPDCNIVINYNYSGNEITTIQMKGRSRKKDGTHIMVGNEKQVEKEMVNAYKAAMMYRAMKAFKYLNANNVNYKIRVFQEEEKETHRFKVEYERVSKSRSSEVNFEILCRRCSTFACYLTDVRLLGHDHLVIDTEFPSKITTKPHQQRKIYNGIQKKEKMYCKKCPNDWGIVAERDGTDLRILKIISFKFRNMRTGEKTSYKKWIEVPYRVPEIQLEDIPALFGNGSQ